MTPVTADTSPELKVKLPHTPNNKSWQPTADLSTLKIRAKILQAIRHFFSSRHVLEVETPQLAQHTVTDTQLHSFMVDHQPAYYLQTSPEYAMKRLLAAHNTDIFQISKAFRNDEQGRYHNPEFSLLEWYRLGFNHHQLMDEVDELLQTILNCSTAHRVTYAELCQRWLTIDCHHCDRDILLKRLKQHHIDLHDTTPLNQTTCLQLLFSQVIEPQLGHNEPAFVYDFPKDQAALAKINTNNPPTAERFEVYYQGIELANGFHELTDPIEQKERFLTDLSKRTNPHLTIDPYFLAALEEGLPECSGIALGLDRLIMLATGRHHIKEVLTFPWDRA